MCLIYCKKSRKSFTIIFVQVFAFYEAFLTNTGYLYTRFNFEFCFLELLTCFYRCEFYVTNLSWPYSTIIQNYWIIGIVIRNTWILFLNIISRTANFSILLSKEDFFSTIIQQYDELNFYWFFPCIIYSYNLNWFPNK